MVFIFDLDGTLCDNSHRLKFIQGEVKDWESFHSLQGDDKPIWEVITVARALATAGQTLIYVTGRMEKGRNVTQSWLDKYRLPKGALLMRKDGDHREDYVVKSEILDHLEGALGNESSSLYSSNIGGAFEDRQQVVDMYRARGLRVFQVAKGDY